MAAAAGEAASHAVSQCALLLSLAAAGVALDQIAPDALASLVAVTVPEELLRLGMTACKESEYVTWGCMRANRREKIHYSLCRHDPPK